MQEAQWHNKIFVGGGFLRSIIAGEPINDVDVFVGTPLIAESLAYKLATKKEDVIRTDNAYTVKGKLAIQVIHRWLFDKMEDVSNSFDFTICCAVFSFTGKIWDSYCDDRFYIDLASKRLIYRKPIRNEDAGGSMLRVLKYYAKGYRIPLDSLGAVMARMVMDVDYKALVKSKGNEVQMEEKLGWILTGLLREVDPSIDPEHEAHLPNQEEEPEWVSDGSGPEKDTAPLGLFGIFSTDHLEPLDV